jgi:predicted dehydrogenase
MREEKRNLRGASAESSAHIADTPVAGRGEMMEKVGFAVIGAGVFGQVHASVYADHEAARLVCVCDIDEQKARDAASRFGARWCTDYREAVADPEVQAVSVTTPDFAHMEIAAAAARAGKHVLCEKPMATTVEGCRQIIESAKASGVILMVDFHNRFSPPVALAKQAVDNGEIGDVRLLNWRLNDTIFVPTRMLSWSARSSVNWFLGSHVVDTICWIVGRAPRRVFSVCRSDVLRAKGIDTPDFYLSVLEFDGGAVAAVENCWILPESHPSIVDVKAEIIGSAGAIYIDSTHHRAIQKYTADACTYPDVLVRAEIHGKQTGFAVESIRHFIDCVRHGKQPLATGEDGLRATRVLLAIQESGETGEPVAVESA